MRKFSIAFILLSIFIVSKAQSEEKATSFQKAFLISPVISLKVPGADMADRFGIGYQFGLDLSYKFGQNWYTGIEGGFLFGTNVKEKDHIISALAGNGMVVTTEGFLDDVNLNLRGMSLKAHFGKSFYFNSVHPNNGLLLDFGIGYLQHKILIDVDTDLTPQLSGQYAKGYDRQSGGLLLSQYIGLIRLQKGKFVNVSLGFEISEGITTNMRSYDFFNGQKMDGVRIDLMYGFTFKWMIPVYLGETTNTEYYTY